MSEYQYYEFQAIDRPLTPAEQTAVSNLSSRVDPHPRRAIFTYSYSDFRGDPKKILAKYYDAMFYIANWGTVQLLFRFPKTLIDTKQFEPYYVEDRVMYETVGDYIVLDLLLHQEESFYEWIEGEGTLDSLLVLRDDILKQDYRVLYLGWLCAINSWEVDEEAIEPPVPPGLRKLTPALRRFADLFGVDEALLNIAAQNSAMPKGISRKKLAQKIVALPRETCDEWLLRLAKGDEAQLANAFQRFLLADEGAIGATAGKRTAEEILALASEEEERLEQQQLAAAEAKRIKDLEAFAPKAEESLIFAEQLIKQGNARAYDEATALLAKLQSLAIHQKTEAAFGTRMQHLRQTYSRRRTLLQRWDRAGLP
ncbi:MAG: hypothetical protein AAF614_00335 [Chloroflexota bacterium]